jgi:hypothetical protein
MEAERLKLKKRLEQITGKTSDEAAERRPYPTVYPMFRIRLTKRGLVVVSSRIGSANCWLPEKPFRPADTWRSQSEYEPTNEDATHALLADSFPLLIFLGFISPLIALVSALVFYAHHRERVEPERRVPVIAFILVLIACGVGAGLFGSVSRTGAGV